MPWQTIGSQNKWRPKQIQENATRGEYETELDSAATWSQKSPIFHDISFWCQIYLLFHVKHIFWDVENRGKLLYVSIMYDQHMTARGRHTRCFSTGPHTNEPTRPALLKISLNISKCVKIPISYISKTGLRLEKTFTSPSACLLWLDYRRSMCFKDQ